MKKVRPEQQSSAQVMKCKECTEKRDFTARGAVTSAFVMNLAKWLTRHHAYRKYFIDKKAVVREAGFVLETEPGKVSFRFDGQHDFFDGQRLIERIGCAPVLEQLFDCQQLFGVGTIVQREETIVQPLIGI